MWVLYSYILFPVHLPQWGTNASMSVLKTGMFDRYLKQGISLNYNCFNSQTGHLRFRSNRNNTDNKQNKGRKKKHTTQIHYFPNFSSLRNNLAIIFDSLHLVGF